ARRVPQLQKDEMTQLASIGALNSLGAAHRRDALWQSSESVRRSTELLGGGPPGPPAIPRSRFANNEQTDQGIGCGPGDPPPNIPLLPMTDHERLVADYQGIGMTIGRHPMARLREEMNQRGVTAAVGLAKIPNGRWVRVAGNVIVRQRPGTAKGVVFMSI